MKKFLLVFSLIFSLNSVFADEAAEKKEEIKWKFYSKNKAHVFVDEISGDAKDTYGVLQTEDLGEITYKNYTFGIRKTLLFFADKENDGSNNFDYVYSVVLFIHCWEQY